MFTLDYTLSFDLTSKEDRIKFLECDKRYTDIFCGNTAFLTTHNTEEQLVKIYNDFLESEGLPKMCAIELQESHKLNAQQLLFLNYFCYQWDQVMEYKQHAIIKTSI